MNDGRVSLKIGKKLPQNGQLYNVSWGDYDEQPILGVTRLQTTPLLFSHDEQLLFSYLYNYLPSITTR